MAKCILNTMYIKPKWDKRLNAYGFMEFNKITNDFLLMVIKDDETNESYLEFIEEPMISYYTIKDVEHCNPYNEMYLDRNLVDEQNVKYSDLTVELCKRVGVFDEYNKLKKESNKRFYDYNEGKQARENFKNFLNQKLSMSPYLYSIDIGIEEFYKTKFIREHGSIVPKILNKSFYDIETFIYNCTENVDQNNPIRPINVITYTNTKKDNFYCLLLDLPEYHEQFMEIKNDPDKFYNDYIKEDFEDYPNINFNIEFFNSEALLITRFFDIIKEDKPDFALAWNSNYDNKYMLGRMKILDMDIVKQWCHPDIPEQFHYFKFEEDPHRNENLFLPNKPHFSRMWDWIICTGYTCYLDQMSLYSNLRKRSLEPSYKLDDIAEKIVKEKKVDLHDFGMNIKNAPVKDFKTFIKYSCRDTKLIRKIEEKNQDVEQYISLTDNTNLRNGVNVSIVIKNAFYLYFLETGRVIGNTIDYGVKESIDGAVVQDPSLVDVLPILLGNKRTKIFKNVVDFDAKSLYPSLMCQFKIGKENGHYRIVSITDENDVFIMSGQDFAQKLQTSDTGILDLGHELYGLPNIVDLIKEFGEVI